MVSKKEALILGLAIVGGLGVASMVAGDAGGGGGKRVGGARAGGILGAPRAAGAPTVYQFAAQPAVTFPAAPTFDIAAFLPKPKPDPVQEYYKKHKGAAVFPHESEIRAMLAQQTGGVYAPGVTTFKPYTKKEYVPSPMAVSAPPKTTFFPAAKLPAAIGIHTALAYARRPKDRGTAGVSAPPKKEVKE